MRKEIAAGILGTAVLLTGCAPTEAQKAEDIAKSTSKYEVILREANTVFRVDCFTNDQPDAVNTYSKVDLKLKNVTCIEVNTDSKIRLGIPTNNPIPEIEIFVDGASIFPNPNVR